MPTGAQAAGYPVRPRISPSLNVIVSLLVLHSFCATIAMADENASEILLKFKTSLKNADPALATWGSSHATPCSGDKGNWAGILCFDGYVWGLQLENMNLQGQIDVNSLVSLKFLRTLSFMNNNFEGTMPDWRKLGALKSLYLSNNKLSGQVPDDAFKSMTSLKKIHMANNKFTGNIPTSLGSSKLIELRLENNQFTGGIPAINFEHLKVLNVSNNQLEGPIPEPLQNIDPSSFSGNKALCGKPLNSCEPPPGQDKEPPVIAPSATSPSKIPIILVSILGPFLLLLFFIMWRKRQRPRTPRLGREISKRDATFPDGNFASAAKKSIVGSGRRKQHQQGGTGKLSFIREDREKFELQDLMKASAEVLGSGNFGASYKAVLTDEEALVVKRFKLMNIVAKEDFHEHMRRIGRLKHPNLLPLVAYLYRKEEKLLVFNFAENGSLFNLLHVKHSKRLTWANRLKIIKGVVKGLTYLHGELPALAIPHGHLKSSNVLIDNEFNPQLMDYTLAPLVNPSQVHEILVAYRAPEYAKTSRLCKKSDVWCLGIMILETLTGKIVTKYLSQGGDQHKDELNAWINGVSEEPSFDKGMGISSESCIPQMEKLFQVGLGCCQEDLENRLDLEEAMRRIDQVQDS